MKEDVPGLQVVYVGRSVETRDGVGYGEWLAAHAAQSGVDVRLIPHVARDQLVLLYARARVLAVPSRSDNFPMVVLEAMASGRAVVCRDEVGLSWLVERVDPGAVVPVGDPDALAAALLPYLTNAVTAARAGEQARAAVAGECSPPVVAARREACYVEARRR